MTGAAWTEYEMTVSLALYCLLPYPKVIDSIDEDLASSLLRGRTLDSVRLRLANFVARDPRAREAGQKGMFGGGQHVDTIWAECCDSSGYIQHQKVIRKLLEVTLSNG